METIEAPWHGTRSGYSNHECRCKPCSEANSKYLVDYRAGNTLTGRQNKDRRRSYRDRRNDLWAAQNGLCALCQKPLELDAAVLDHDHKCCYKMIPRDACGNCDRGALHLNCNLLLGHAQDDVDLLALAIAYLEAS